MQERDDRQARAHPDRTAALRLLALALAGVLVLAACGIAPDPNGDPDPDPDPDPQPQALVIDGGDVSLITRGSVVVLSGANIAGNAAVSVAGVPAIDVVVRDATDAVVAGDAKDGASITFSVPVLSLDNDGDVEVVVEQSSGDEDASVDLRYLVDGFLDEDFEFVFDFAAVSVGALDAEPGNGLPAGLSLLWDYQGLYQVSIVDDAWARNGRALSIAPDDALIPTTVDAFVAVVFDELGDEVGDVEVLVRMRDTAPASSDPFPFMTGVGSRLSGSTSEAGEPNQFGNIFGQFVNFVDTGAVDPQDVRTFYVNEGADGSTPPIAHGPARGDYLRVRWTSDIEFRYVSFKVWSGTRFDEPADWDEEDLTVTTADNAELGSVGIARFFREHTSLVDYIAVNRLDTID